MIENISFMESKVGPSESMYEKKNDLKKMGS